MRITNEGITEISVFWTVFCSFLVVFLILGWILIGYPLMKPFWSTQTGKAELAQAEQNRQIKIIEAQAAKESAVLLAEAEVSRARGVAQANEIIAGSINENYLKYLFVQGLQTNQMQTIYVPLNGLLPVMDYAQK